MRKVLRPAVTMLLLWSVVTGLLYPLTVSGMARILFPFEAEGSLIRDRSGAVLGSHLIGQPFADPAYFWGRPSATSPGPYNGAASSGSNLGPTNPALARAVSDRIVRLRAVDPDNRASVPADLVTASASGLDPHISPAAAEYQVARVARYRHLSVETVRALVARCTEPPTFGILGQHRVNVLSLNLLLDGKS
ncbi:MAG: potassium-transporting ATPase subunit KdpC [Methylotetracoccus sp.]